MPESGLTAWEFIARMPVSNPENLREIAEKREVGAAPSEVNLYAGNPLRLQWLRRARVPIVAGLKSLGGWFFRPVRKDSSYVLHRPAHADRAACQCFLRFLDRSCASIHNVCVAQGACTPLGTEIVSKYRHLLRRCREARSCR
jgi:hypothetical protein